MNSSKFEMRSVTLQEFKHLIKILKNGHKNYKFVWEL